MDKADLPLLYFHQPKRPVEGSSSSIAVKVCSSEYTINLQAITGLGDVIVGRDFRLIFSFGTEISVLLHKLKYKRNYS